MQAYNDIPGDVKELIGKEELYNREELLVAAEAALLKTDGVRVRMGTHSKDCVTIKQVEMFIDSRRHTHNAIPELEF